MRVIWILLIALLSVLWIDDISAQAPVIPVIPVPQIGVSKPNIPLNPHSTISRNNFNAEAQRRSIMQEVQEHQHSLKDLEAQKDLQNNTQLQFDIKMLSKFGFPSLSEKDGTSAFYNAFDEIDRMLKENQSLNLGRAVFLVENAYHNNKYDYSEYKSVIKNNVDFCNKKIEEEKLDRNDNLVKNMMLFRFICDTLKIKDNGSNKSQFHYPIKYNYEDYQSKISYDSHFVTTLMQTNTGQCHSMPLYYLILAEEIGAEAYWSFSPLHSFIKIQDEKGIWHNLELTCKAILSDVHYMNNSYIKAEALQNKIYLEPIDKQNTVAEMLLDLARGYYAKYGYDDFYLKCVDTAQQYLKNDLNAKLLRSAYQTRLTLTLAHLLNAKNPDVMKSLSIEAYQHYELMQNQYTQIDNMGYEELPTAIYGLWLDNIAKEKMKAEKTHTPSTFKIPRDWTNDR